ncbi:zinc-binding dehydrogenase [Haloarcula litorea]|uniref:zinc-binding dehydrogenase n=1 Tax=Haloarcula litorea TaxID=3032579 RepID=UPI0023E75773|nr:zinc-binding dehydrogenase [Halomicroarcula sp. GDY20]
MRAAVFTGHGEPLEIRSIDAPTPEPTGVVVQTEACGICRSDWHAWQGDPAWAERGLTEGHVLGHEPAGTVVAVGEEVETVREGDHVAVPFNLGDGTCHQCRTGHANLCDDRIALGLEPGAPGAFAEQVHVPRADANVVALPDGVSSVEMAGLGCRFMTAFHGLVHRADVDGGDWVAVHGCGGVGLSAVHVADALGARVVAVDLFEEKLDFARRLGADETVDADDTDDVPAAVRALTDGGAHVAVDALGVEATCRNAIDCLRKRGQHVQIGLTTAAEGGEIPLPTDDIVGKEIDLVGAIGMQPARYDEILRFVQDDAVDPGAVVSEHVTLDDTPATLAAMTDYETFGIPVITEF